MGGVMELVQKLPHDLRRAIYSVAKRPHFELMQLKRQMMSEEYSFKPFDESKTIFVHIPKAAGVSICKSLYGSLAGGHTPISRYQYVFSKKDFCSYFKFTFVRNPWDRLFSAYTFLKKGGFNVKDEDWATKNLSSFNSFEEFVMGWVSPDNVRKYLHFIPQTDMLFLPGTSTMPIDFIGFFENIEDDFNYIAATMNKTVTLPYFNKTEREESYLHQYNEAMIAKVAEVYRSDIETFGYVFDNSTLAEQLDKRSQGQLSGPH
jgi:hypothetical protein